MKSSATDDIIDRQKREKNLIIFNISDQNNDMENIKEILSKILSNIIQRIGKSNRHGRRKRVRVTLSFQAEVFKALKNKHKLKGHDEYIAVMYTVQLI